MARRKRPLKVVLEADDAGRVVKWGTLDDIRKRREQYEARARKLFKPTPSGPRGLAMKLAFRNGDETKYPDDPDSKKLDKEIIAALMDQAAVRPERARAKFAEIAQAKRDRSRALAAEIIKDHPHWNRDGVARAVQAKLAEEKIQRGLSSIKNDIANLFSNSI